MRIAILLVALTGFLIGLSACASRPYLVPSGEERWSPAVTKVWSRRF